MPRVLKPQRDYATNSRAVFWHPPDIPGLFTHISRLLGVLPAGGPMVYLALRHLAVSLLRLRNSAGAVDSLHRARDAVLATGLFSDADGYYTGVPQMHIHKYQYKFHRVAGPWGGGACPHTS